jgi:Mg-chelatase subunit ChlD
MVDVVVPPAPTAAPSPTATDVPTAEPPTATPVPTDTPVPTATPKPRPLFLPLLFDERCKPRVLPQEVVLVVDTSSSMTQPTQPGGPTKLDAAREAALALVRTGLNPADRVALVTFDGAARTRLPLSADRTSAAGAIGAMLHGKGSRIDLGLLEAAAQLQGRRTEATAAVILLTDGRPTAPAAAVRAAADRLRAGGAVVYAIGLGSDVDGALLTAVAGAAARYVHAPDASDLVRIYTSLPVVEPCRP